MNHTIIDLDPMQINSSWLLTLMAHGYTQLDIHNDACVNVQIDIWILRKAIANGHSLWEGESAIPI